MDRTYKVDDDWLEKTDREKKRRAEQIKSELAGSLSSLDEDIIDEWAFELNI